MMPQIAPGKEIFNDDGTALITRTSITSKIERTLKLPITEQQYQKWKAGNLIQEVMPQLTAADREFLMSGMIDAEWKAMWGDDD